MFTLHRISGYIQTIYLVEYPDKLMLLDGCCRADIGLVCDFIEHLGRPLSDLALIVVTHMHPDHAGGAHGLRKITGAKLVTADVKGHWYQGIDGFMMHLTDILLAKWVASRMGKPKRSLWYSRRLMADYRLHDGDSLPGFADWQVLHCPGHTDRDLALYHQGQSFVYIADLLVKVKGNYIPPYPLFYPNRYRNSLLKIQQINPRQLLLAHGGQVDLADINLDEITNSAPKVPVTHWRSVKAKTQRAMTSWLPLKNQ
ncbi:MBL fold metallo-hydrolase [Shewanella sp. NIFS-20-20]|uniref:MBL fold metallo-hydrolase n=1 Tax=Shewanella sp. NIFS-20-20 TaxID=2853806 RepID=UPI001C4582DC|nr:MBL fold metallo-hydrolase [Shewanella sp. NIFS-20-20]MBV7316643.1 MBL fold metallo-hydrolase [Shewanella sp. NIFS-20-20]